MLKIIIHSSSNTFPVVNLILILNTCALHFDNSYSNRISNSTKNPQALLLLKVLTLAAPPKPWRQTRVRGGNKCKYMVNRKYLKFSFIFNKRKR